MADRTDKNKPRADSKTLTDEQIATRPKALGRRSVLLSLGAGAASVGMAAAPGARAQGFSDSDTGPYADPAGRGRGHRCTDSDVGNYADPVGRGRGTGYTDNDGGANMDPVGCGRGRRSGAAGPSDSDSGQYVDPAGQGRGGVRTGITDSDSGRWADPPSGGRWGSKLTDSDDGPYFTDQAGSGRRGW